MTRRRLLEILVAAAVFVLLLAVLFVRPTARKSAPPPVALFTRVLGAPPDFSSEGFEAFTARSPDGRRIAVLYPHDFEGDSDLYLLDGPGEGTHWVLVDSLRATNAPKAVGWVDGRALWVTVGYKWGTVSPGGDAFLIHSETGLAAPLWSPEPDANNRVQAVSVAPAAASVAGGTGGLVIALKVFDWNMDHPRDSTVVMVPAAVPWERIGLSRPPAAAPRL